MRWRGGWLAVGLACSASSSAPQLAPVGSVGPRPLGAEEAQALTVVYAGPRGAAALGSSVNVLFNKPMRAVEAAADSALPNLQMSPAVPGAWQWVGARALTFVPTAGRLPAATSFRVSIPAGLRGLEGDPLSSPYELEFETPAPEVVATQPEPTSTGQEPDLPIVLTFNQPVAASAVERAGRLSAWRGEVEERLEFSARARPKAPNSVEVVPRRKLPLEATIEFKVEPGLQGTEGPRPLSAAHSLRFDTYGPLRVVGVNCHLVPDTGRCDPEGSLWVELSNPVKTRDFQSHLGVEPPVSLLWPEELDDESRYFYLPLTGSLAPATAYRVSLAAGLADTYEQKLGARQERLLTTGNFSPRVRLPISGEVFPAPLAELSLRVRNAPGLRVFSQRLDAEKLLDYFQIQGNHAQRDRLAQRLGASEAVVPGALDNLMHTHPIQLGPVLGVAQPRGAAWLGWRFSGSTIDGQLVQVTDLALTAKLSAQGSLVWVTRLSDGSPVAKASVELYGRSPKISKRFVSDAAGLVVIPAAEYKPNLREYGTEDDTLLFARHEGDSSFRRVADFLPPWRIEPAMRLSEPEREYGLLFSERGIYRPGDVVRVKGVWRREAATGNDVLPARKLTLLLQDPFGEVAGKHGVETTRFGTFALDVPLPGSASLGSWRILAEGFEDDSLSVEVAEYRAAEFKVRVDPAQPSYVSAEPARFRVQADYLFGSPMGGAKLGYGVTRERSSFAPPKSAGFVTSDDAYRADLELEALHAAVFARGEAQLSAEGAHELSLPLALPGQTGPEQVRLDAEVTDVSRQAIAASAAVLVHPASHYVGIAELDSWFQRAPALLKPRILALTPAGERRSGRKVSLDLVRRRWTVAREKTGDGWRTLSQPVDEVQASCEVVSGAEPVSCELPLRESGQFFIRANSKDERGRSAQAALGFYAIGPGRAGWADNDRRKLELVLDKPQYRVGDTARVLIKSPFQRAEALLTVERAGLYEHRRLTLEGPTPTVEIKIDDRLRPNAFVSVHLVQGVAANAPAVAEDTTPEPGFRLGYAELIVDPEARRLAVKLTGQSTEYRPRQKVSFDLQVTRAGGAPHPAELTVYAVDEGVLALSGYQPPDPVALFTRPRPLGVATLESRDALGRLLLPGPERDKGMDGGGGEGPGARSNFRTTAHFDPNLVTDAEGRARVEFELPDNLTTFRLMAVAVSQDDRYGVGSTLLTVNQPLMIRPALPRFLRAGDRVEAAAIVTSRNHDAGTVKVSATVTGATLHGAPEQQVALGKDGSAEVRFTVEAKAAGEARFAFAVASATESDRVELVRAVASPAALEASAVYGQTEKAEAQALADLSALRDDVGGLELQLAATAMLGLDAGLTQLTEYPYACTEQLVSRLLPLGPLVGLGQRYGVAVPAQLLPQLEAQVGEILRRQRGDGGFGLWPSSPETHPWASGYALWVLWQAKQAGARIPERAFLQGANYLRQFLGQTRDTEAAWATAALMVDVLAALGQPDAEYVAQLFEQRAKLPSFALALLLHAAASGASDTGMVGSLTRELEALITLHGNKAQVQEAHPGEFAELFDSEARTEALVLRALLRYSPQHPLASALAKGVLDRRVAGRWRSTQESAYALLALDAYRQAQERELPQFDAAVWLGERKLLQSAFKGPSVHAATHRLGMPELRGAAGQLIFEKQGPGTLFYEARLRYAPRELPQTPLERGFSLRKSHRVVRPESLAEALGRVPDTSPQNPTFAGGDLVLVDLVVAAPTLRHFVVIEDPLPAGLEAVDARLRTTSAQLDIDAHAPELDPGASGFQSSWYRRELRDDRVLFFVDRMPPGLYHYRYLARASALGRFVVPPTRAEEMYQPEVFGRSGASTVEVR